MQYEITSHRHALIILESPGFSAEWNELKQVLDSIEDQTICNQYPNSKNKMSISAAINHLISNGLVSVGWKKEVRLFQEEEYTDKRWRLDFAKKDICVEVAFNHGEAIAWNLLKPVISSELNHVKKEIQTKFGIVIFATEDMKKVGAFDDAVGSYEKAIRYLRPMNNILTIPMLIIGLKAPKSFRMAKEKDEKNRNIGKIEYT